jgi:hypothetical protein
MGQSTRDIQRCCPFTKVHLFVVLIAYTSRINCRARLALKCYASGRQEHVKSRSASKLVRAIIPLAGLAIVRDQADRPLDHVAARFPTLLQPITIDAALDQPAIVHRGSDGEEEVTEMQEVSHLHGKPVCYKVATSKLYIDSIRSGHSRVDDCGQRCDGFTSEEHAPVSVQRRIKQSDG